MFDFAWSQIALIGVVALIAIGPKDLPVAIRAVTGAIKKARKMAAEFQTHVDEMVKEANLQEVRDSLNEVRNFDIKSTIEKAIDPDNTIRDTFASNPLEPAPPVTGADFATPTAGEAAADAVTGPVGEPGAAATAEPPRAPAFIPPGMVPPPEPALLAEPEAPAFIPPEIASNPPPRPNA